MASRRLSLFRSVQNILLLGLLASTAASCPAPANAQAAGNDQAQLRGELEVYDAATKTFTPYLSGVSAGEVEVSPDRQWVAYVTYPDLVLWRSKLDGSEKLALTRKPMNTALPHWSPDSQRVVFMGAPASDKIWTIYVASVTGGDPQQVLAKPGNEGDPCWISNNEIVYGISGFGEVPPSASLHRVNVETHEVSDVAGSESTFSPRCSSDGHYLVAIPTSFTGLRLLEIPTGQWSTLTNKGVGYPAWSRDGKYVFVQSDYKPGGVSVSRVSIADHHMERVASFRDVLPVAGRLGTWSGLSADDSPILLRQYTTKEQAELLEVEQRIADGYSRLDSDAVARLMSDDLIDTGPAGFVTTKDQDVAQVKASPSQFSLEKMRALAYGDFGVVTGIGHARFSYSGRDYIESWRFTDTFRRGTGGWQLVATHQTRLPEPYVRDVGDAELQQLSADSCTGEGSLSAVNWDVPSFIRFVNRNPQPVKMYWMNYQGKRDGQRTLMPGEPADIYTFSGHSYVVVDESGKCTAVYHAGVDSAMATIGPNQTSALSQTK